MNSRKMLAMALAAAFGGRMGLRADEDTVAGGGDSKPSALAENAKAAQAAAPKPGKKNKGMKKAAKPTPPKKAGKKKASGANKGVKGPAVLKTYAPKYRKGAKDEKTAGGNRPIDNDDKTAKAFRGKSLDDVYKVVGKALAPDVTEADLRKKYKHLNVGMQRMNLGNRYRAALNAK